MKINPRLFPILSAFALLAACGKTPESASTSTPGADKQLTIAVIPKATTHSYWKAAQAGTERAAKEFGVKIEWQGPLDDSKVADQIAIFNNLAASGVDGIVLSPCDDRALAPHVITTTQRGVPISIFDSPLDAKVEVDFINFVSTDNKKAGATAAETLIAQVGDAPAYGGRLLMIRFTEGSASTRLREEGFAEKIAGDGKLKIDAQNFTDGSMAGAQRVAETMLGNYVKDGKLELDAIFASNQPTAEGTYNAVRALKDQGVEVKTKFVGFDDSELLLQGLKEEVIHALVIQDPEKMGYLGVKSIVDYLKKQPVPPYIDTGVTVKMKP